MRPSTCSGRKLRNPRNTLLIIIWSNWDNSEPWAVGYIERRGDFLDLKKKGSALRFFFGAPFFFLKGIIFNVPFFPPSFFFFWEALFSPKGCFLPFFRQIFWFCCFYVCCQPLFLSKSNLPFKCPFFIFFELALFFSKGSFLGAPFFAHFFFFFLPFFRYSLWQPVQR